MNSALNCAQPQRIKTSDFFNRMLEFSYSNHYTLATIKLTSGHKMKNQGSVCSSVLWKKKKKDLTGRMTREEGVTRVCVGLSTQVPLPPSSTLI